MPHLGLTRIVLAAAFVLLMVTGGPSLLVPGSAAAPTATPSASAMSTPVPTNAPVTIATASEPSSPGGGPSYPLVPDAPPISVPPPLAASTPAAVRTNLPEAIAPGWVPSYRGGALDSAGIPMGGSELMHLVAHDGMLFAAVGYWEDTANIDYGGTNSSQGWAQILRLDSPNSQWVVDLTETGVVRPEILKSVTFTTNATGVPLSHPVNLLLAAGCDGGVNLYTRNDTTGSWVTSKIVPGPIANCSVRAMTTYQDPVTGVDRVFVSAGPLGIFSGAYDPAAPGDVLWGRTSESGNVYVRPLAIVEANGNLLASAGALIYERVNGPSASWKVIVNETGLPGGGAVVSAVGGIRGLTAIPNPNGPGQSLLFLWCPGDAACGTVIRLDPNGSGGYTGTNEIDLSNLVSKFLGTTAGVALGAYNNFLPVTDPATGQTDYIIGLQTWVSAKSGLPTMPWANSSSGIYEGALYAIRESNGTYRMGQVNGMFPAGNPPLEAIRSYTISPFSSDNGSVIYFGGYDADGHPCLNTAWVFRTTLANALGEAKTVPVNTVAPGDPSPYRVLGTLDPCNNTLLAGNANVSCSTSPGGMTYVPGAGEVALVTGNSGNLSLISQTTNRVAAVIPLDADSGNPLLADSGQIAYDPVSGEIIVPNYGANNLSIVSVAAEKVLHSVPLAQGPAAVVFDPRTGQVFVAVSNSSNVSPLWMSNFTFGRPIPVGVVPLSLAYAPWDDEVYVGNDGSYNVSVLSDVTDAPAAAPRMFFDTEAMLADPTTEVVWGATPGGTVPITTGNETTQFDSTLPGSSYGLALDNSTGLLFATEPACSCVSVFSDRNGSLLQSISVGTDPRAITFDPATGDLYVANGGSGTISVLEPTFPVNFIAKGLPPGAGWTLNLSGSPHPTTTGSLTFDETDGNYTYSISSANSSFLAPPAGNVQVDGSPVNVTLLFRAVTYPVSFIAKGLPPGAAWTLNLSGELHATSNGTQTFDEPNGSYSYSVSSENSSILVPPAGSVEVDGTSVNVSLIFQALAPFTANFTVWYGLESCAANGAVTNAITLNGTASGGLSPYSYQWTLPAGSASGPQANTTLTYGGNTTVSVTASDSMHHSVTVSRAVGVEVPSCHSAARVTPNSLSSLELWELATGVGGAAVASVAIGLLLLRRRRVT